MVSKQYLSVDELSQRSGLSVSTIWRLKRSGQIPYFQPAGENHLVKFPFDAIECGMSRSTSTVVLEQFEKRLPGPQPKWTDKRTL
jgi:predicted DNA-binding transcriptional regulator AlpA